jgi:hypothetical protein
MAIEIEVQRLVNFETATDGTAVKLIVADIANREIGIILKIETLTALLMTLPAMASSAVKRAHNDPSMRITYPLREFDIEFGPDNLRILAIGTPDGFKVSFSLTEDLSLELGSRDSQSRVPRKQDRYRGSVPSCRDQSRRYRRVSMGTGAKARASRARAPPPCRIVIA